jgi:mevalonate kinase
MNYRTNKVVTSAPAKIILFGEHFVVYSNSAIVAAINKRISVQAQIIDNSRINIKSGKKSLSVPVLSKEELITSNDNSLLFLHPIFKCIKHVLSEKDLLNVGINLDIDSQIPYGEGLGSSAASCVSTVGALYSLFSNRDRNKVYETARVMEQNIHTNSSGIDCYVSTFGGIVNFEPSKGFRNIRPKKKFTFLVGTTGVKHSTGEVVSEVKQFRQRNSSVFKDLSIKANAVCKRAIDSIHDGNEMELGNMLTENHKLLLRLGVSHPKIEKLIEDCLDNGALGAKLTGAGKGGSMIALMPNDRSIEISTKISRGSDKWMLVEFDYDGVVFG